MDALIVASVIGLGYFLNTQNESNSKAINKVRDTVPNAESFPNPNFDEVNNLLQDNADKKYTNLDKMGNAEAWNADIGKYAEPLAILNQSSTMIPIKKSQEKDLQAYRNNQRSGVVDDNIIRYKVPIPEVSLTPKGPQGSPATPVLPFFRGSPKGSIKMDTPSIQVEKFTFDEKYYKNKKEIPSLYDLAPQQLVSSSFPDQMDQSRFTTSFMRNGVLPFPQENVPAILPEYVRPETRTIDETRTKNNPKISYRGRVNTGEEPVKSRACPLTNFKRKGTDLTSNKQTSITTAPVPKEMYTKSEYRAPPCNKFSTSYVGNGSKGDFKEIYHDSEYGIKQKLTTIYSGIDHAVTTVNVKDEMSRSEWYNNPREQYGKPTSSYTPAGGIQKEGAKRGITTHQGNRRFITEKEYVGTGSPSVKNMGAIGIQTKTNNNTSADISARIDPTIMNQLLTNKFNITL